MVPRAGRDDQMAEDHEIAGEASIRVAILIPSLDHWAADFGLALAGLLRHTEREPAPGGTRIEASVHNVRTSILPQSRSILAEYALENGADWALWLDSDMIFPADTLHRLLAHGKNLVATNCPMRSVPRGKDQVRGTAVTLDGDTRLSFDGHGLVEAGWTGLAVCLMRVHLLESIDRPWFSFDSPTRGPDRQVGEGTYFFEKLRAAGHTLFIDRDLSREIGHLTQTPVYLRGVLSRPRRTVYTTA